MRVAQKCSVAAAAATASAVLRVCCSVSGARMGKKKFNKAGATHYHIAGFAEAPSRVYNGVGEPDCCPDTV